MDVITKPNSLLSFTFVVLDFEQVLKLEPKNKQAGAELQIAKRLKEVRALPFTLLLLLNRKKCVV